LVFVIIRQALKAVVVGEQVRVMFHAGMSDRFPFSCLVTGVPMDFLKAISVFRAGRGSRRDHSGSNARGG
jgi:hypothetical protein